MILSALNPNFYGQNHSFEPIIHILFRCETLYLIPIFATACLRRGSYLKKEGFASSWRPIFNFPLWIGSFVGILQSNTDMNAIQPTYRMKNSKPFIRWSFHNVPFVLNDKKNRKKENEKKYSAVLCVNNSMMLV